MSIPLPCDSDIDPPLPPFPFSLSLIDPPDAMGLYCPIDDRSTVVTMMIAMEGIGDPYSIMTVFWWWSHYWPFDWWLPISIPPDDDDDTFDIDLTNSNSVTVQ